MKLKSFFLFFIVLFPVLIYLFLQTFGENKFEIPVYVDAEKLEHEICPEVSINIQRIKKENVLLMEFRTRLIERNDQYKINRNRLENRFKGKYQYAIENGIGKEKPYLSCSETLKTHLVQEELDENLNIENWLVLIDRKRKVRGFYLLKDSEEVDRLIIEMTLLLDEN